VKEGTYQKLGPDFHIRIPPALAEKLGWDIGSDIYIEVFDEDLRQALVGKKLVGQEMKQGLAKLQKQVSDELAETNKNIHE
jgi:antitoxin component of MazEF toxin-antitoxin module